MTTAAEKRKTSKRGGSKPPAKRQIGRPDSTGEVVGPDALIEKTCELLARMPPAKVTRAEVARYAGVDPSLIRYYFQNRTSLLVASAEKLTTGFDELFKQDEWRNSDAAGKVTTRMGALLELIVSHPFYHRLLTEELFTQESAPAARLLEKLTKLGVGAYKGLIDEGLVDGSVRELNPAFLFVAIVGMCDAFVSLGPVLDIALGKSLSPQIRRRMYEDFIADLLVHGISRKR